MEYIHLLCLWRCTCDALGEFECVWCMECMCVRGCSEHCCVCPVGTVKQCACESSQLRGMVQSWVYFYTSYVTHTHTHTHTHTSKLTTSFFCTHTHFYTLFSNKNTHLKYAVNIIWFVNIFSMYQLAFHWWKKVMYTVNIALSLSFFLLKRHSYKWL